MSNTDKTLYTVQDTSGNTVAKTTDQSELRGFMQGRENTHKVSTSTTQEEVHELPPVQHG